jgi:hypothetical protein
MVFAIAQRHLVLRALRLRLRLQLSIDENLDVFQGCGVPVIQTSRQVQEKASPSLTSPDYRTKSS